MKTLVLLPLLFVSLLPIVVTGEIPCELQNVGREVETCVSVNSCDDRCDEKLKQQSSKPGAMKLPIGFLNASAFQEDMDAMIAFNSAFDETFYNGTACPSRECCLECAKELDVFYECSYKELVQQLEQQWDALREASALSQNTTNNTWPALSMSYDPWECNKYKIQSSSGAGRLSLALLWAAMSVLLFMYLLRET